jgi:hypothetical protein
MHLLDSTLYVGTPKRCLRTYINGCDQVVTDCSVIFHDHLCAKAAKKDQGSERAARYLCTHCRSPIGAGAPTMCITCVSKHAYISQQYCSRVMNNDIMPREALPDRPGPVDRHWRGVGIWRTRILHVHAELRCIQLAFSEEPSVEELEAQSGASIAEHCPKRAVGAPVCMCVTQMNRMRTSLLGSRQASSS